MKTKQSNPKRKPYKGKFTPTEPGK